MGARGLVEAVEEAVKTLTKRKINAEEGSEVEEEPLSR